ncbi:MAG: hypothetical protein LBF68_02975 [Christensenellaceae bacterium]|nr:hypothetical protein [Christensenellaceae bacterium]
MENIARAYNDQLKNEKENSFLLTSIDLINIQLEILKKIPSNSNMIKIVSYVADLKRYSLDSLKKLKQTADVPRHSQNNFVYNSNNAKYKYISLQIELYINIDTLKNMNLDLSEIKESEIRGFSLIPYIRF